MTTNGVLIPYPEKKCDGVADDKNPLLDSTSQLVTDAEKLFINDVNDEQHRKSGTAAAAANNTGATPGKPWNQRVDALRHRHRSSGSRSDDQNTECSETSECEINSMIPVFMCVLQVQVVAELWPKTFISFHFCV